MHKSPQEEILDVSSPVQSVTLHLAALTATQVSLLPAVRPYLSDDGQVPSCVAAANAQPNQTAVTRISPTKTDVHVAAGSPNLDTAAAASAAHVSIRDIFITSPALD